MIPKSSKLNGRVFLIHSMPRTASTSLRTWLNQQDDMLCHGEILGPNKVHGTSVKQTEDFQMGRRNRFPYDFARTYFADHDNMKLMGFKALSSHLLDGRNLAFVNWYFEAKPKVILLYRDDLVARFKSGLYHRLAAGNIDAKYVFSLRPRDVVADCVSIQAQWQMANQYWTRDCERVVINIKDLSSGIEAQLEELLGVKMAGDMPRSNAQSTQQAKADHPDLVAHVEKICSHKRLDEFRQVKFDI